MTDRDDFLAWVRSALYDAELALHDADAGSPTAARPRRDLHVRGLHVVVTAPASERAGRHESPAGGADADAGSAPDDRDAGVAVQVGAAEAHAHAGHEVAVHVDADRLAVQLAHACESEVQLPAVVPGAVVGATVRVREGAGGVQPRMQVTPR